MQSLSTSKDARKFPFGSISLITEARKLSAAEQLAYDEAALHQLATHPARQSLRLWSMDRPCVVLGRSQELKPYCWPERCQRLGVPILRRASGGGCVLLGEHALCYSLVLSLTQNPALRSPRHACRVILERLVAELQQPELRIRGLSDLALDSLKVAGHAQKYSRHGLLHHGCVLLECPTTLMTELLKEPDRRPDYREARTHAQFVRAWPGDPSALKAQIAKAFAERLVPEAWDLPLERLMDEKYGSPLWHEQKTLTTIAAPPKLKRLEHGSS